MESGWTGEKGRRFHCLFFYKKFLNHAITLPNQKIKNNQDFKSKVTTFIDKQY